MAARPSSCILENCKFSTFNVITSSSAILDRFPRTLLFPTRLLEIDVNVWFAVNRELSRYPPLHCLPASKCQAFPFLTLGQCPRNAF